MSSVTFKLDTKSASQIAVAAIAVVILTTSMMAVFFAKARDSGDLRGTGKAPDMSVGQLSQEVDASVWSAFFRRQSGEKSGKLAETYRLAGTFFEFGAQNDTRRAIIDDIGSGAQHIVSEGQAVEDILVLTIAADHILVRAPSGAEEELWLSFRDGQSKGTLQTGGTGGGETTQVTGPDGPDEFGGRRVGENRWVFERKGLIDYYTQLMEDPERLVRVFDSLKPVYTDEGTIEGYKLEVFGEAPFFKSTGLAAGDIVRSVNSINMTNRRRAEYLISEFVNDRVNVIVMEIERNGKQEKLVYQIR